ncbi:MAG: hypothetical protein H8D23_12665 [Candidatus Brocadiales bacterium]|nr:hypothetical protein [Candidatus Brocadiales bacterium]
MVGKCKSLVMFVALVGISCMVLNFAGMNAQVYAHGSSTAKSSECPLDKGGKCASHSNCKDESKCDKGGCHKIDEMMDLTRCAKKELLKEKIKANLEKKIGTKLDKVADLLVDAMLDEYRSTMQGKARKSSLQNDIREVFSEKGPQ